MVKSAYNKRAASIASIRAYNQSSSISDERFVIKLNAFQIKR